MENTELSFKFTIAQINVILKWLGSGAFVEVESVINEIRKQAAPQLPQQSNTTSEGSSDE